MFLTDDELKELTGKVQRAKQIAVLAAMGYTFRVRPTDKRPMVARSQVDAIGKPARRREPQLDHLEHA
jgi:hypothetical protein